MQILLIWLRYSVLNHLRLLYPSILKYIQHFQGLHVLWKMYEAWTFFFSLFFLYPFQCQLHHTASEMLKYFTPFHIRIPKRFLYLLSFNMSFRSLFWLVTNKAINKNPYFRINVCWDIKYVPGNCQELPGMPWGPPDKTTIHNDLAPLISCFRWNAGKNLFILMSFHQCHTRTICILRVYEKMSLLPFWNQKWFVFPSSIWVQTK